MSVGPAAGPAPAGAEGVRGADGFEGGPMPGARVGRFEVLGRVGEGGMGVVYAAYDPALRRKIALKLLRHDVGEGPLGGEVEARLRCEAQAMARLAHPNVAAVYDAGRYGGSVFVALEFVEGQTLSRWLEQNGRSPGRVLGLFTAAGRGLEAAHRAGLVHRDFKPQNVLVGDDGRVRVVDFGLARSTLEPDAPAPPSGPSGPPSSRAFSLTHTGMLLGTPLYMAPEQMRGEPADEKSDQFSFCVALYEALYGERPFAGASLAELRASVEGGRLRPAPRGARVPGRLRRVLARGLSASPGDRFASMGALLEALAHDPLRRARPLAFSAAALGLAAGAALFVHVRDGRRLLCQGAERHLARVWDGPRREALEAALGRTGVPYARSTAQAVARVFDRYAADWAAQRVEACEATRVRGEQTDEVLGLRMACLDDRLREFKALGDRLLEGDRELAQKSVQAAHSLSELAACADVRALSSPLRPPPDAATRAEVEALRGRLAEARASLHAGLYRQGLEAARPSAERARELRYRPLEAEALFLVGQLAEESGDYAGAELSLQQAVWAAEAGRHDEVAAHALVALIKVEGLRLARYEQVEPLARRVLAANERSGDSGEREAQLLEVVGAIELQRSRYPEAERSLVRALALLAPKYGEDDLRLTETLRALGKLAAEQNRAETARTYFERVLNIRRRALGDDHPEVAEALGSLATAVYRVDHGYAQAEALYRRALSVFERALGPEHPRVATTLNNLALACELQGRYGEAIALQRRSVAVYEKAYGPEHPATAVALAGLSAALEATNELPEALALGERALGLMRKAFGADHVRIAEALHENGRLKMKLGRLPEALEAARQSDAMNRRVRGEGYPAGPFLQTLGEIYLRMRRPARAVESLEAALKAHREHDDDPGMVAQTNALLARALWGAGPERDRARALAIEARERLKGDARLAAEFGDLERWMRQKALL